MNKMPIHESRAYFRRISFLILHSIFITMIAHSPTIAQEQGQVVRIARLQIDPAKLDSYKAALKEEIETSIKVESGVLSLYAVSEKNDPSRIIIFEIYANQDAYLAHLEAPHFKKYKNATKEMVRSLELKETIPLALETKLK
jgi:quinol monooxygenase YgiN